MNTRVYESEPASRLTQRHERLIGTADQRVESRVAPGLSRGETTYRSGPGPLARPALSLSRPAFSEIGLRISA
jgi:hypothetical protein